MLILSGNLSFLNWLTILSAIFCFDDLSLQWLFSAATKEKVVQLQQEAKKETAKPLGKNTIPSAMGDIMIHISFSLRSKKLIP